MKRIKFKRAVSVDYFSARLQEWVDHTFERNDVITVESVSKFGRWADIKFRNGDKAESVSVLDFDEA